MISTAHDLSAYHRAFSQGKLLPDSLRDVITDPVPGQQSPPPGGPCAGNPGFQPRGGSAPGFVAVTYTSPDGRLQFAVSVTVAMDDGERAAAGKRIDQALKSVFCPTSTPSGMHASASEQPGG